MSKYSYFIYSNKLYLLLIWRKDISLCVYNQTNSCVFNYFKQTNRLISIKCMNYREIRAIIKTSHVATMQRGRYFFVRSKICVYATFFTLMLMESLLKSKAKAKVSVSERRRVAAVPARYATACSDEVPTTSTFHTLRTRRWSCRIRLTTTAIRSVPVLTPLIDVTTHIVDA